MRAEGICPWNSRGPSRRLQPNEGPANRAARATTWAAQGARRLGMRCVQPHAGARGERLAARSTAHGTVAPWVMAHAIALDGATRIVSVIRAVSLAKIPCAEFRGGCVLSASNRFLAQSAADGVLARHRCTTPASRTPRRPSGCQGRWGSTRCRSSARPVADHCSIRSSSPPIG